MAFNTRNYNERDWVRIRPSLSAGFDFGQINDILSDDRLGVSWSIKPNRDRIINAEDVIRCAELGEGQILAQLTDLLSDLRFKETRPPLELVTPRKRYEFKKAARDAARRRAIAIELGLEYWLDLRRDGCDAQVDDLAEMIINAERLIEQERDRACVAGSAKGGCNG